LRNLDVALGGQGAPIVPIGDTLLFAEHQAWLNIGGIANISIRKEEEIHAFDIVGANQIFNVLAQQKGKAFDEEGALAKSGQIDIETLNLLNKKEWFQMKGPKSLSNDMAMELAHELLDHTSLKVEDKLATFVAHVSDQIENVLRQSGLAEGSVLVSGGGALNTFLIDTVRRKVSNFNWVIPDAKTINFKEALVMALIGALRWREEVNVLKSVTGARQDSVGGAFWLG